MTSGLRVLVISAVLVWSGTTLLAGSSATTSSAPSAPHDRRVANVRGAATFSPPGAEDTAAARGDSRTAPAQYSALAKNTGGTLGGYLKTVENMSPALKATPGDFAQEAAALDAAYGAMVRAIQGHGDPASVEQQGREAIQHANEAINAQGRTEEYTDKLLETGAGERQRGTTTDQSPPDAARTTAGSQRDVPVSVLRCDTNGVVRYAR